MPDAPIAYNVAYSQLNESKYLSKYLAMGPLLLLEEPVVRHPIHDSRHGLHVRVDERPCSSLSKENV